MRPDGSSRGFRADAEQGAGRQGGADLTALVQSNPRHATGTVAPRLYRDGSRVVGYARPLVPCSRALTTLATGDACESGGSYGSGGSHGIGGGYGTGDACESGGGCQSGDACDRVTAAGFVRLFGVGSVRQACIQPMSPAGELPRLPESG